MRRFLKIVAIRRPERCYETDWNGAQFGGRKRACGTIQNVQDSQAPPSRRR